MRRTLAVLAIAGVLAGCERAVDITAKPGEAADQQVAESQPAAIFIAAPVELARIEDEIAKQLPGDFAVIGRRIPRAVCTTSGGKQTCLDVRLTGHILRDGPARIAGTPHGLELSVPLRYELIAQPFGSGGNTPVNGKLSVIASFAMTLDEHWQPTLKLDPVYRWGSGDKIKVLDGETAVQADVEPVLTQRLQKLAPAAQIGLVPAELRQQVELSWRYLHYPIALSQEHQIWLRGTPLGLRCAGIVTRNGVPELRMAITARLQTFVGERPAPLPPSPLPAPGSGPEAAGGGIVLPSDLPYEALTAAAAQHLPAIPIRNVAGEAAPPAPEVTTITFYAAGKHLGVGVHFGTLPGGSWLSPHGVAYFLATPSVRPGTSELFLTQTEPYAPGARTTPAQKEMPFLTDARFADNVGASMVLDAHEKLAAAVEMVKRQASLPLAQGLHLFLAPSEARIARISPGIDALRLQIEVGGEMTIRREGTDVASDGAGSTKATP